MVDAGHNDSDGPKSTQDSHQGDESQVYSKKDDAYFSYYAQLSHQAQMLQDSVRTTAYQRAILGNAAAHYQDKLVMDVGAGNGILSLFALQAGAKRVYAVEASGMVEYLQRLVSAAGGKTGATEGIDEDELWYLEAQGYPPKHLKGSNNSWIADRLVPVHSKAEDVTPVMLQGNAKVDTIVSECLGVLLLHERMCESFIDARDRFLRPGGAMFPSAGTICFSPIEDKPVWDETAAKARFWLNPAFYNVDLTPFFASAWKEAFSSPVIGCFNPQTILSTTAEHQVNFQTVTMAELEVFEIPLHWTIQTTGVMHGIGGWFDLDFAPDAPPSGDTTDEEDAMMEAAHQPPPGSQIDSVAISGLSGTAAPFQPSGETKTISDTANGLLAAVESTLSQPQGSGTFLNATDGITSGTFTDLNTSSMSTSPRCPPTHWQQARLLLPEPLAVNRGQTVKGWMKFQVNDKRSYDISAELVVTDGSEAHAEATKSTRRRCQWKLDKQTYSWTTTPTV